LGSRMGKGKGKAHSWFMQIPACTNIISFKNLRPGRFYYFFYQVQHKLRTPLLYKSKHYALTTLSFKTTTKISYTAFW
jgi:ribosomal protein L16/L10AE